MAQGTLTVFEEVALDFGKGVHNFTDTYKIALITTIPLATQATPRLADFTEVSGTNYTAGGEALTLSWVEAAGVATLTITDTAPTAVWLKHASGPTNIKAGLIYNFTNTATKEGLAFIDFTPDGSTAISLADDDIEWDITEATNRILTLTVS